MNDFPEFDNLPDDPEVAFVRLYEGYNEEYQRQTHGIQDTRAEAVEFMNSMIGIAAGLDIDEFAHWEIPEDWDEIYPTFTNFDRAIKRYVVQIKLKKPASPEFTQSS